MITKFIEVTNEVHGRPFNWGKFMVARFTEGEWGRPSSEPVALARRMSLLHMVGWGPKHILVVDLQTGEGAIFYPGGYAKADLEKHKIWVCPMFEPFLEWLYTQDLSNLDALPGHVHLKDAPADLRGYRREGP